MSVTVPVPNMTYHVFGGTLSLTQSVCHSRRFRSRFRFLCVFFWVVVCSIVTVSGTDCRKHSSPKRPVTCRVRCWTQLSTVWVKKISRLNFLRYTVICPANSQKPSLKLNKSISLANYGRIKAGARPHHRHTVHSRSFKVSRHENNTEV